MYFSTYHGCHCWIISLVFNQAQEAVYKYRNSIVREQQSSRSRLRALKAESSELQSKQKMRNTPDEFHMDLNFHVQLLNWGIPWDLLLRAPNRRCQSWTLSLDSVTIYDIQNLKKSYTSVLVARVRFQLPEAQQMELTLIWAFKSANYLDHFTQRVQSSRKDMVPKISVLAD